MMKLLLLLSILSVSVQAEVCQISAKALEDRQCFEVQTSFEVESLKACRELAQKSKENLFFGVLMKSDRLIETRYVFKSKTDKREDTLTFEDENCI